MFQAEDLVKQAIERHGDRLAVACSFGKDSIVVLHMALKYEPKVKVIFCNTGVEFPETIRYKEKIAQEWDLNLIETKPIKTFWQCIDDYGVPQMRGKGNHRVPKCCIYCKEKPALEAYRSSGVNTILTGITAAESRQRDFLIKRYDNMDDSVDNVRFCGQRYYIRTENIWKYHPIAYWGEAQVWHYIDNNAIPINPVYEKWGGIYDRVGCLPCTAYKDWEQKLSKTHPKLYLRLKELADPKQMRLV